MIIIIMNKSNYEICIAVLTKLSSPPKLVVGKQ